MSAIIINDPLYGFTSVPRGLLGQIIDQPEFQRLDHIRQLGTSSFVYPSAKHSRKQHSIGAFHLMQEALLILSQKGEFIFDSEREAAEAAILLHDVGHGPFSHVLENVLTIGVHHEEISLKIMERINRRLHGDLSLAIKIFKDEYPKHFLHELLSSQLDVDRMDYVNRDSFYCGVQEGSIGTARIIKMLNVRNDHLVVEHKGLHTVENYLMARRLMYWQVYLHKTVVAAEEVLRSALRRAKWLARRDQILFSTPALHYFLYNHVDAERFSNDPKALDNYLLLTDADMISALNVWQQHDDKILSILAQNFMKRRLFKVEVFDGEVTDIEIAQHVTRLQKEAAEALGINEEDASYFVTSKRVEKDMYSPLSEGIGILQTDDSVTDVGRLSNIVRTDPSQEYKDRKHYVFHQRL
ncbi:HD domain-containing protein [Alloprevotella sp. OH1205_COT-284]|uniref:HD domain-containing protein n=1 Tax=Alloprevotella sp. OH1205_COT-284 TaxID=2491043 RepID=UPI000F5F0B74|nr:HD domain-containing protein [Alloprevotella sp. OH1205_COT-284]RRD75461.1 HD domain-containing protein [Alloprevotella sp. OH1205_COT-284]